MLTLLYCKLFVDLTIFTDGFLTLCKLMGIWRTILSVSDNLRSQPSTWQLGLYSKTGQEKGRKEE